MISIRKKNHAMNFIVTVLSSVFLLKSYCILLLQNQSILMRISSQRSFNALFSNLNPWILLTLKEGEGCTLWEYNKDQYREETVVIRRWPPQAREINLSQIHPFWLTEETKMCLIPQIPIYINVKKIIFYCSCHPKCTWWTVIISLWNKNMC